MCYVGKDVKVMTMKMLMVGGMRWSVGWSVWQQGSMNRMSLTARDYMSRMSGRLPMYAWQHAHREFWDRMKCREVRARRWNMVNVTGLVRSTSKASTSCRVMCVGAESNQHGRAIPSVVHQGLSTATHFDQIHGLS